MSFKDPNEVWQWLESFTNLERTTGPQREYRLDRMFEMAKSLGNPQTSFKAIHIAGSKGKGSFAWQAARTFAKLGQTVGLFMSPHIADWRERICSNNGFFPDDIYLDQANFLKAHIEGRYEPTTFELLTLLAFLIFKACGFTYVVLETGLGGRLDATNICEPIATILTHLELEHTDILGPTLSHIAYEKAMISKKGIPLFTLADRPEVLKTIVKTALENYAWVHHVESTTTDIDQNRKNLLTALFSYLATKDNSLAQSVKLIENLGDLDLPIGRQSFWQDQDGNKKIFLDGAHTKDSISHAWNIFDRNFPGEAHTVLFGLALGKNESEILPIFNNKKTQLIITQPGTYKQSDSLFLYKRAIELCPQAHIIHIPETEKAFHKAISLKNPMAILGSFHLLGAIWNELPKEGFTLCR